MLCWCLRGVGGHKSGWGVGGAKLQRELIKRLWRGNPVAGSLIVGWGIWKPPSKCILGRRVWVYWRVDSSAKAQGGWHVGQLASDSRMPWQSMGEERGKSRRWTGVFTSPGLKKVPRLTLWASAKTPESSLFSTFHPTLMTPTRPQLVPQLNDISVGIVSYISICEIHLSLKETLQILLPQKSLT